MRRKIVAGNWKMNLDVHQSILLANAIVRHEKSLIKERNVKVILFPQVLNTHAVAHVLRDTELKAGVQNLSMHESGAFTGEISATNAKSIGCEYSLIGHSERRTYFLESNQDCSRKIIQALSHGLKVVYCVGETLEQRNAGEHFHIIEEQCKIALNVLGQEQMTSIVIAYEPVWAIGTGVTASPEQAQEMHAFIRGVVKSIFGKEVAEQMSILYGGSCNADNAKALFSCNDIDGGLIGSASLKAEEFMKIIGAI